MKQGIRWWEFYVVRYAQGAVAGAIILHILIEESPLKKIAPFLARSSESNIYLYLLLLLVCGLAYSYIAGGPILVMHAARGLMFKNKFNRRPVAGWRRRSVLLFILTIVLFFYIGGSEKISEILEIQRILLLTPYSIAVSFQLVFLYQILFGRDTREAVRRYYVALLKKRKELEESEYIESYRHLREHGNSFFIVMFQIFFALAIWEMANSESLTVVVTIFLFWVFPPSLIWFFGNALENNLLTLSSKDLLPDGDSDNNRDDEENSMNNNTGADSTKEGRGLILNFMEKLDGDVLVFFFSLAFSCVLLFTLIIAVTVIVVSGKFFGMIFVFTLLAAIIPIVAVFVFFKLRPLWS